MQPIKPFLWIVAILIFVMSLLLGCNSNLQTIVPDDTATRASATQTAERATVVSIATQVGAGPLLTAQAMGKTLAAQDSPVEALTHAAGTYIAQTRTSVPTRIPVTATARTQLTPTPTSTITASPAPGPAPNIITFTVSPTTTRKLGDTVTASWHATGTRAVLCPYVMTPGGPVEQTAACADVSLAGTKSISIQESDLQWNGLLLRVANAQTIQRALASLVLGCQGFRDWFFNPAPANCPEANASLSSAAFQSFERGAMVWTKDPDRFYVFYDDTATNGVFEMLDARYSFKPGASTNNRIGETPPQGLFEPVSGFGQIWRGELYGIENVRARVGWATAPERAFDSASQCEMASPSFRLWRCYLRLPDGHVLRLHPDSTAQVHFVWEEYP